MAKLYTSQESLNAALNTIVEYLRDSGFEGTLEDGTGLADIVLKPNAVLYDLFVQIADRASAYQSLARAQELRDSGLLSLDDYDDAVDAQMSNWFVSRHQGTYSYGRVRLLFSEPQEFLLFSDGQQIATVNDVSIVVDGQQTFSDGDFTLTDYLSGMAPGYYVDVNARTAEVTSVFIDRGSVVSPAITAQQFLSATIPSNFTVGTGVESSEDFIARTQEAITSRELITRRAIDTVLMQEFPEIRGVYVAGMGSVEQLRSFVQFPGVEPMIQVGNAADIYVYPQLTVWSRTFHVDPDTGELYTGVTPVTDPSTGEVVLDPITGDPVTEYVLSWPNDAPFASVLYVRAPGGEDVDLEYTIEFPASDDQDNTVEKRMGCRGFLPSAITLSDVSLNYYKLSLPDTGEQCVCAVDGSTATPVSNDPSAELPDPFTISSGTELTDVDNLLYSSTDVADSADDSDDTADLSGYRAMMSEGLYATVYWLGSASVPKIDDFVFRDEQRVVCYNPYVRHKFPVVMSYSLKVVKSDEYMTDDAVKENTISAILAYTQRINDLGESWSESAIVHAIQDEGGVFLVVRPMAVSATIVNPSDEFSASDGVHAIPHVANTLALEDFGTLSKQVSVNTVQYYTDRSLIYIDVMSEDEYTASLQDTEQP